MALHLERGDSTTIISAISLNYSRRTIAEFVNSGAVVFAIPQKGIHVQRSAAIVVEEIAPPMLCRIIFVVFYEFDTVLARDRIDSAAGLGVRLRSRNKQRKRACNVGSTNCAG